MGYFTWNQAKHKHFAYITEVEIIHTFVLMKWRIYFCHIFKFLHLPKVCLCRIASAPYETAPDHPGLGSNVVKV